MPVPKGGAPPGCLCESLGVCMSVRHRPNTDKTQTQGDWISRPGIQIVRVLDLPRAAHTETTVLQSRAMGGSGSWWFSWEAPGEHVSVDSRLPMEVQGEKIRLSLIGRSRASSVQSGSLWGSPGLGLRLGV